MPITDTNYEDKINLNTKLLNSLHEKSKDKTMLETNRLLLEKMIIIVQSRIKILDELKSGDTSSAEMAANALQSQLLDIKKHMNDHKNNLGSIIYNQAEKLTKDSSKYSDIVKNAQNISKTEMFHELSNSVLQLSIKELKSLYYTLKVNPKNTTEESYQNAYDLMFKIREDVRNLDPKKKNSEMQMDLILCKDKFDEIRNNYDPAGNKTKDIIIIHKPRQSMLEIAQNRRDSAKAKDSDDLFSENINKAFRK